MYVLRHCVTALEARGMLLPHTHSKIDGVDLLTAFTTEICIGIIMLFVFYFLCKLLSNVFFLCKILAFRGCIRFMLLSY